MARPTRIESWPKALNDYIEARRDMPFKWGRNDCATFALEAVLAITGSTAENWAFPAYNGRTSAGKLLLRMPLGDWARQVLGDPLPGVLFAQRGDVVLHEYAIEGFDCALGICYGAGYCAPGKDGLLFSPSLDGALAVWRI